MIKYAGAVVTILILFAFLSGYTKKEESVQTKSREWEIKAIDTVKYSRDLAREKAKNTEFNKTIEEQLRLISETGATHVAVGTPYDPEFLPFLKLWVSAARKYDLNVWFRGNLSGWENWFGYSTIDKETHIKRIEEFILNNGDLFEQGDVFSSCPECENGAIGDPRDSEDLDGYRKFLIEEYRVTSQAFRSVGKGVRTNFFSMNGDVAKLVMDKETTQALGGIVVVDHYVETPDEMIKDLNEIKNKSGGKIVLGEFGLPITDIHGEMDDEKQAEKLDEFLKELTKIEIVGINYWTSFGGSTKLWENDYSERLAVNVLKKYFLR